MGFDRRSIGVLLLRMADEVIICLNFIEIKVISWL